MKGINENDIKDWTKGTPLKSGNYLIKNKQGRIARDDYSTVNKIWWNSDVEYYSPSSYREL